MPLSDTELLRAFAHNASEAAFAELVHRRLDFVYAAALRQVGGDAHRARDIAQEVFIKLARNAAALTHHTALLGWLCTTTRNAAMDAIRREQRRKTRETEAMAMHEIDSGENMDWTRLQPVLDEALAGLKDGDREVVLARFFDRQSFGQIGHELGISENAAQHRTERALDKLRVALSRRRITSTSAALGVLLANQPGVAAPAGLATSIAQAVVGGAALGSTSLGAGFFTFMSTTKTAVSVAGAVGAIGLATLYLGARAAGNAEADLALASLRERTMTGQLEALEKRLQAASQQNEGAERKNAELLQSARQPATVAIAPLEGEPLTSDVVAKRAKTARELARSGDPAEALRELIWCYTVGMPRVGQMGPPRSDLLTVMGRLAERHPPALAWLLDRRDEAKRRSLANEHDEDSVDEYGTLNLVLNDHGDSIALLDSLPPGDPRRRRIANSAYPRLVDAKRYRDAMEGTSFVVMIGSFEGEKDSPQAQPGEFRTVTLRHIETLAGTGQLSEARELAARLLKFDSSPATRTLIQQHAERAGQPALLDLPATAP